MTISLVGLLILLLIAGLAFGETGKVHVSGFSTGSWLALGYLVVFGSLVGFTAYIYLLNAVSPAKASTHAYVNPIVAVLLGWAIAHEPVTPRMIAGAAVILGGVAMISTSKPKPASS